MDPLGNIPLFLSTLKTVDPARRRLMLLREIGFAYVVLLACARSKMKAARSRPAAPLQPHPKSLPDTFCVAASE